MSEQKQRKSPGQADFEAAQAKLRARGIGPPIVGKLPAHLVGRTSDRQAFTLQLGRIRVDARQVRKSGKGPDDPETIELAADIKANGLTNAIAVRWLAADDVYQIVAGERRFVVAQMLGWTEIPVRLVDVPAEQVRWLQLGENLHRKGLEPLELAAAIREAMDGGLSITDVAGKCHKSKTWVQQALTVAKELVPEAAAELAGKPLDTIYRIATVPPAEQPELARQVVAENTTGRDVRLLAAAIKKRAPAKKGRSGRPVAKVNRKLAKTIKAVESLRRQIRRDVGVNPDEELDRLLAKIRAVDEAKAA